MRLIPVEELRPNTTLAVDTLTPDAHLLFRRGSILSKESIHTLRMEKVEYVYISDKFCLNKRTAYTADFTVILEKIQMFNTTMYNATKNISAKETLIESIQVINEIVRELDVEKYTSKIGYEPTKIHTPNECERNMYVAIASTLFALKLGFDKTYASKIFLGAILRDIAIISPTFQGNFCPLNQAHPVAGYEYMRDNYNLPEEVLEIILQHHELYDGKGLPNGLKGDEICDGARIISIIDIFFSIKAGYMKQGIYNNIEQDFNKWMAHCDPSYVSKLLNHVNIFAPDTLVKLTNNDIGVVLSPYQDDFNILVKNKYVKDVIVHTDYNPFKPLIYIIESDTYPKGSIIDLREAYNLNILQIIYYVEKAK
ncbi:MAG: hypothetical protein BEN18_08410 [Epulopiscium sp. Nuni2H_MBin001]|nr:MAG: hypothetical protein BEN18_08410 [Epulopiscium sp. Nuni2H_MBin001]